MAVYSVNQATQMYVGEAAKVTLANEDFYYTIDDGAEVTGIIKKGCMLYKKSAEVVDATAPAAKFTVTDVKQGDDIIVRLSIATDAGPQYAYLKTVSVKAASATATEVAAQIRTALKNAALRDVTSALYDVETAATADVTVVPVLTANAGKRYMIPAIEVMGISKIEKGGKDLIDVTEDWVVKNATTTVVGSGLAKLKDLEYFYAGEKGDIYRGAMWPNDIPFESKVATLSGRIYMHTIHYYESLDNEASQKSEKTLVIVNNEQTIE